MSAMASQITSLTIVYSTVYSGADLRVTGLCPGNSPVTGEFPVQRGSNTEKVPIWWRHHVKEEYNTGYWECIILYTIRNGACDASVHVIYMDKTTWWYLATNDYKRVSSRGNFCSCVRHNDDAEMLAFRMNIERLLSFSIKHFWLIENSCEQSDLNKLNSVSIRQNYVS